MIALFVLKLATGIALMWLLMPRREVADGFFRIQMLVVLGLTVLLVLAIEPAALTGFGRTDTSAVSEREQALAATGADWLRKLAFAAAAAAWPGHIFWKLGRRIPGTLSIWLIGLALSAALAVQAVTAARSVPLWQQLLADVGTAGVLGSVLTAMLLGHWYLTTPTMSLQPLRWFCPVLAVAAAVRLAATAAGLLEVDFAQLDLIRGLWLSLRILGGIVAPAAAAILVRSILQYRNTQSATGVLFAVLILVFMGEMSAGLLERDFGLPL